MTWHGSTTREGLLQVLPRVQRPSLPRLDSGLWEEHTQARVRTATPPPPENEG